MIQLVGEYGLAGLVDTLKSSSIAVVGAGGAGDVVSALVLCRVLADLFDVRACTPVAVLWERWSHDPFPGPIPRGLIRNARLNRCTYINRNSYVVRGGKYVFKPQASLIAEVIGREIPSITLERGVNGVLECLNELSEIGYSFLILLDVGGDILAHGWEDELWSPLTDAMVLAAASKARLTSVVAVLAPGADGELPRDYVINRVNKFLKLGAYLGLLGLWREHIRFYEDVLPKSLTEAGKVPYDALRGSVGVKAIRNGSREVIVDVMSTAIYIFKVKELCNELPLPRALASTKSLAEAVKIAEELGIQTELHLEVEAARRYGCGPKARGAIDWVGIRSLVKERIRKLKLKSYSTQ